jgi:hypothetical protein
VVRVGVLDEVHDLAVCFALLEVETPLKFSIFAEV